MVLHVVIGLVGWWLFEPDDERRIDLVDIEMAPAAPPVEALAAERAKAPEEDQVAQQPPESTPEKPIPGEGDGVDAGVDAPIDAAPDAATDARPKRKPDAGIDAPSEELVAAGSDAGVDGGEPSDATTVTEVDPWDQTPGSGSGSGDGGSGSGSGALAQEDGSGSGKAGATDEVALDGAPTTAGTAANLLAYFPKGHTVTALIRFDRLRGTEWLAQTERLLRPMPDYQILFGPKDAKIGEKIDTLVISTPRPKDATATTLVAHTRLSRPALRAFLGATTNIAWTSAKGGMLGRRTSKAAPGDRRMFLAPFKSWFMVVQPGDVGALAVPAPGTLDQIEATGKLPPWLAGIRKIEAESGDPRGPALVLTVGLGGQRMELGAYDFGLGVKSFPTPDRVSLAMEVVKQGWLVRGNMRFVSDAAATVFVTAATTVKDRIANSKMHQLMIGKAASRVIANLSFARSGPRVSYTTSISIADTRALMAIAAQYLDGYYGTLPSPP